MKDIFTSSGNEKDDFERKQRRISFDDEEPEAEEKSPFFTYSADNFFEDFDTGRDKDYETPSPSFVRYDEPFYGETKPAQEYSASDNSDFSDYEPETVTPDPELPHESTDDEFVKPKKTHTPKEKKKKEKKKSGAKMKIVTAFICIILILALAVTGYAYLLCGKTDYQPDTHVKNEYIEENMLFSDKNVYNILVLGTDKRETESTYRSDTMILVSLDKNTKKIKLTSFLRDSFVYIPAKGFSTKLNAACSYGGPQMVIDTLEYNFKVHIDKYVMIDFDIFKTIIHDLGGVTLTMTEEEAACIRRESGYACKAGTHNYKAKIALWYARIRHIDSDFKRTERQRKVIQAVIDKMKKSSPAKLSSMLNHVLPMIQTDISQPELFKLGITSLPFLTYDIEEMQIPAEKTWSNAYMNGQAVLKLDFDKNVSLLKDFIYSGK